MCLPPATVRWLHWDGRPRCRHRGVVCKAIRACSRCVYRRLLCGGCTGTGALDVFTPIHRPFEFFSKSQRTSPMENFFNVKTPQKVKVVKPRTNVLTERSHFCLLIPVDVTGLGHTTLSIPHRVRSNVLSRASDDAVPAKVFLAPMSVVPGAAHTQRPIA